MVQYYLEFHDGKLVTDISIHSNYKEIVEYIHNKHNTKVLASEISDFFRYGTASKNIFKKIRIREVPLVNGQKILSRKENKKTRMKCKCGYSNKYAKHTCTKTLEE